MRVPGSSGVSADLRLALWRQAGDYRHDGRKWDNPGIYFDPLEGDILPGEPVIKHDGNTLRDGARDRRMGR
jgi:suppressor for copper-sensitivity B